MPGSLRVKHFFNTQFKEMLSKSAGKKNGCENFQCSITTNLILASTAMLEVMLCLSYTRLPTQFSAFFFISIVFEQKEKNYWDPLVCSVHASEHACSAFMACKHSTMQYKKVV